MRKNSIPFCLLMLNTLFCAGSRPADAAITLVREGKPLAKIYSAPIAPQNAPPEIAGQLQQRTGGRTGRLMRGAVDEAPLTTAVRELNYHLQKMSGATLQSVTTADTARIKGPAIVLGELAVKMGAVPQKTSESKEGFRLLVKGDLLLIGGESDEGTLFGVYELLGKLGCDWVLPGEIGEVIPRRATIEVAALDESQTPDFQFRNLWYSGGATMNTPEDDARFAQWMRRQKNGSYWPATAQTGGHAWDKFIKRHQKEFDADPTMLALRRMPDGTLKRKGPQLESTHPRVIELFVQDIRDEFARNNWPKNKAVGFPIGPADGLGYSISPEAIVAGSGRIDPIVGEADQTDLLVLLGNKIFERLEGEYPNLYLGFYSYSVHADYPARYQPHPRLVQIFAPILFSRYHSVLDEKSETQAYYKNVVEQWSKLSQRQGNPLIYRGYNWNLAEDMVPYTKLKIWGDELPFYKKMGVIGLNVEAIKAWSIHGPHDYLFMKLAWDSGQDWRKVLAEYCRHSFGAGAAPMERYFLRQVEAQHGAGQEAGSYHAIHLIYNDAYVAAAERDIAEASRLAATPQDKTRIEYIGYGVEALKLYLAYHRATMNFDFAGAKTGYDAMMAHNRKVHALNSDLVTDYVPRYLKRFLEAFVQQGLEYSSGEYRIVERLPDQLPTRLDPQGAGAQMQFFSPALSDSGYFKTKTFSTTWDAQGLSGTVGSAVWYRHHFQLPADLKGKPIGLFIGGVEDEVRVWINGVFIGASGARFSVPFQFDLTDGIRAEGDNVLALQVIRNTGANELGTGGILRPSFLFTGPRLKAKAPQPAEVRRVLPGGELGEVEK